MRLATITYKENEIASLIVSDGAIPISDINKCFKKNWNVDILSILKNDELDNLSQFIKHNLNDIERRCKEQIISNERIIFAPLYRKPSKIWGIGLNYVEHAGDLSEKNPVEIPGSFMKADTTIIGYRDTIKIPKISQKTTGESELGIIIGKKCKNVKITEWREVVAGFTTIIDMTAEDILRRNTRYLTVSKNFDTFFSFGPELITTDEINDINNLKVSTVLNGEVHASNIISNMTFPPDFLVSFHSQVMTLLPGDIISTGTPRAVQLKHGDIIECRIDGFKSLENYVEDLKIL